MSVVDVVWSRGGERACNTHGVLQSNSAPEKKRQRAIIETVQKDQSMANTLANRRYVEQLEGDMKKLKQEKTAAERCNARG